MPSKEVFVDEDRALLLHDRSQVQVDEETSFELARLTIESFLGEVGHDVKVVKESRYEELQEKQVEEQGDLEPCQYCGQEFKVPGRHEPYCSENPDQKEFEVQCDDCGTTFNSARKLGKHDCSTDHEQPQEEDVSDSVERTAEAMAQNAPKPETGEETSEAENGEGDVSKGALQHEEDWGEPDLENSNIILGLDKYEKFECSKCGERFTQEEKAEEHRDQTGHVYYNVWTNEGEDSNE